MKIEVNPSKMTIDELSDCIAELTAQRERLLKQECEIAGDRCHDAFYAALRQAWDYTESGLFDITLDFKTVNGRRHHIPLNMEQIEFWNIEVERKMEQ
jgi:hypothetical protein